MVDADTFYAIDFDRCLSDTDKLDHIFYEVVDEYTEIDGNKLRNERKRVEGDGGSFDEVEALEKQLGTSELINNFFELFIKRAAGRDILSPGAHELIEALETRNLPYGIVSYGGPKWQHIKMMASRVDLIPTLITDHKQKGQIFKSWQQDDNTFLIPAALTKTGLQMSVESLVFMDDKAIAFIDFPEKNARGYWIKSLSDEQLLSQQGKVPTHVRIAQGLNEVIEFESL